MKLRLLLVVCCLLGASGCGGGGGGSSSANAPTTLTSSVAGLTTYASLSAGDVNALSGATNVSMLERSMMNALDGLSAYWRQLKVNWLPVAYAANSTVVPSACKTAATKIAGTQDEINWTQLKLSSSATEPCISSIQDARTYVVLTAPGVQDASGHVCDLIFLKKRDGTLYCFTNALETGAGRVFNYALGSDSRPAFGPQIGMGTYGASAYLSQNGRYFFAAYQGTNGVKSFVGVTSFDLSQTDGPVGAKLVHLLNGVNYSQHIDWFQGMENGDAYVAYSKPYDAGGADLTASYVAPALSTPETVIVRSAYTAQIGVPTSSMDKLKEFVQGLPSVRWELFSNYQIIPDPQASASSHSFFAVHLTGRRMLKINIDDQNAVAISDLGDTRVRYYFFSEGGYAYGPASYYSTAAGNHGVGDECVLQISDNYNATDCDFYLVKHDLSGVNPQDQKLVRLFPVGRNAWDYVPVFRTASKVFVLNYNQGNGGDPFLGETFWNGAIPIPSNVHVINTANGLDANSPVAALTLNPTGLDLAQTSVSSFNVNYAKDLLLLKGTQGGGAFTAKIKLDGVAKLNKYADKTLFPDGIQYIAN